jgi:hypothetical protein
MSGGELYEDGFSCRFQSRVGLEAVDFAGGAQVGERGRHVEEIGAKQQPEAKFDSGEQRVKAYFDRFVLQRRSQAGAAGIGAVLGSDGIFNQHFRVVGHAPREFKIKSHAFALGLAKLPRAKCPAAFEFSGGIEQRFGERNIHRVQERNDIVDVAMGEATPGAAQHVNARECAPGNH